MQLICIKYAQNMHKICTYMHEYAKNMHKYAIMKYAQICTNMHKICTKYAINMQRYARPANIQQLPEYKGNMQEICRNMQYMQSGIKYAEQ